MITCYSDIGDDGLDVEVGVNLEFEKESHEAFAENVLWLFVKLNNSSCSAEEHELLLQLLEKLTMELKTKIEATFAGYRIVEGWFEIYFYAYSAKKFENIAASIVASEYNYSYEIGSYKDTKYKFYFDELYPDIMQLLQIQNTQTISLLQEAEDNGELPREVEHYLFFATNSNAQRAVEKAAALGFTCKDKFVDDDNELRHTIILIQSHNVTYKVIDMITQDLLNLAMEEHGLYEGWSTTLA